MKRRHALVISLVVAAGSVAGLVAATRTTALGAKTTKPTPVARAVIVKRKHALDRWEASLRKTLATRPPRLPRIPHYPHVYVPVAPAYTPAPVPAPPVAPPPSASRQPAGQLAFQKMPTRPAPAARKPLHPARKQRTVPPAAPTAVAPTATPAPPAVAPESSDPSPAPPPVAPAAPDPQAAAPPAPTDPASSGGSGNGGSGHGDEGGDGGGGDG